MIHRHRRSLVACAVVAVCLAAATNAFAQDLAGTSAAIPPFKLAVATRPYAGHPGELLVVGILMKGVGAVEGFSGRCFGCTGPGRFLRWRRVARGVWKDPTVGKIIVTRRTRWLQWVYRPGFVGRFKTYATSPSGRDIAVKRQGCLSPSVQTLSAPPGPAAMAPCSGVLLPSPGSHFGTTDPVTVSFRVPHPLPKGHTWAIAFSVTSSQKGCANWDEHFFTGRGSTGQLLIATFRSTDQFTLPSASPQWCTGPADAVVFDESKHSKIFSDKFNRFSVG